MRNRGGAEAGALRHLADFHGATLPAPTAPVALGGREKTQAVNRPLIRGRSRANVCPASEISYCQNVGKDAYNATGSQVLRNVRLGEISDAGNVAPCQPLRFVRKASRSLCHPVPRSRRF